MGVTYHFGYPNMQRIVAIDEAVNNAQNGEKYQVNYRGKYRPLTVIEVPIEMLVYAAEAALAVVLVNNSMCHVVHISLFFDFAAGQAS